MPRQPSFGAGRPCPRVPSLAGRACPVGVHPRALSTLRAGSWGCRLEAAAAQWFLGPGVAHGARHESSGSAVESQFTPSRFSQWLRALWSLLPGEPVPVCPLAPCQAHGPEGAGDAAGPATLPLPGQGGSCPARASSLVWGPGTHQVCDDGFRSAHPFSAFQGFRPEGKCCGFIAS